jgi:transcriptional regulator with XRE-family HTH domain
METTPSIGAWLRSIRGKIHLRTFAAKVGVDMSTLSRVEREETQIRIHTLVRICNGLDLSPADFFADWLGEVPAGLCREAHHAPGGVLTAEDARAWMVSILGGNRRHRELLISALNQIVDLQEERSPGASYPPCFALADIEKVLWPAPFLRFEMLPPLGREDVVASIGTLARLGGLVLPVEIGAYIGWLRERHGLSVTELAARSHLSVSALLHIEAAGFTPRAIFRDLLELDTCLHQDGALVALVWWEVSARLLFEEEWKQRPLPASCQGKHALLTLMISIGRWLQVCYPTGLWLSMIRYELGLLGARGPSTGGRDDALLHRPTSVACA